MFEASRRTEALHFRGIASWRPVLAGGSRRDAGFSLIEVIIVVAVIAVLAAVAVPVADLVQSRARTEATLQDLDAFRQALEGYYQDNLAFPDSLAVLQEEGYLSGGFSSGEAVRDAWGTRFEYETGGYSVTVRSLGPDKTAQEPNLDISISGLRFLRERTRDEMETIHVALRNYERMRQSGELDLLPSNWWNGDDPLGSALGRLIEEGLLPNTTRYVADAWGDVYEYPGSPADFVRSGNITGAE